MTGRCETCRWFEQGDEDGPMTQDYEPIEPGRWGRCSFVISTTSFRSLLGEDLGVPHSERAFPQDASDYQAWLIVRSDFGCIEHEPVDASGGRMGT